MLLVVSLSLLLSDDVMHRCSDFHSNGALQIFYDDDDDVDDDDDAFHYEILQIY